jgi:hypothetical protein
MMMMSKKSYREVPTENNASHPPAGHLHGRVLSAMRVILIAAVAGEDSEAGTDCGPHDRSCQSAKRVVGRLHDVLPLRFVYCNHTQATTGSCSIRTDSSATPLRRSDLPQVHRQIQNTPSDGSPLQEPYSGASCSPSSVNLSMEMHK